MRGLDFLIEVRATAQGGTALSPQLIARFRRGVRGFYRRAGRSFPWRDTHDPYAILVSEVMLQQTQTSRVLPKYLQFMKCFPTLAALAKASLRDVLQQWQGLGYNRRAKSLQALAQVLADQGIPLPRDEPSLRSLPGVGEYTARAVLAFAYDEPVVLLETNIRSVYLYTFFEGCDRVHDRQIRELLAATVPKQGVREWYYALMDIGAALKRELPAVGRQSHHYRRQAPFHGSVRQARGAILKALSCHEALTEYALRRESGIDDIRIARGLSQLVEEGFIRKSGRRYSLE